MRCISSTSSLSGLHLRPVAEEGEFEPEAREDGAQIVADTPASIAVRCSTWRLDAVLHVEKGLRRLAHFGGAARPEIADVAAHAETLRRTAPVRGSA